MNGSMRLKLVAALFTSVAISSPANAQILWSNGTTPTHGATANQYYSGSGPWNYRAYDNFTLTQASTITGLFGSYQSSTPSWTVGHYEIRSGLSNGNLGTLVASGSGAFTPTATSAFEYFSELLGLNISLAAGNYWLFLAPESTDDSRPGAYSNLMGANTTNALNAAGDLSYWMDSQAGGGNPQLDTSVHYDLAYGAYGVAASVVATPEPASMILLATGLGFVGFVAKRRRR